MYILILFQFHFQIYFLGHFFSPRVGSKALIVQSKCSATEKLPQHFFFFESQLYYL